ncbi:hypothetical protein EON67_00335 [archaeon]|nr:MAG: hypothetical protein EON67_00335 [archaeon]
MSAGRSAAHAVAGGGGGSSPATDESPTALSAATATHVAAEPVVATGHSTFDYARYGLARITEYMRLKEQLRDDRPAWFAHA